MSSRSNRNMRMKNAHITAIVIGIMFVIGGLYFIFVISANTDKKNAECTEHTVGTVTSVTKSDSKYRTEIDYEIEGFEKTLTVDTKKDLGVGNTIDIYYEPMSFSHLYIEGVSETGKNNIVTGLIIILAGGLFLAYGIITLRKKKAQRESIQSFP